MTKTLVLLSLLTTILAPLAAAQDTTNDGDKDVNVNPPDVDMNVDNNDAEESTFAGLSTTVVIILIVLAVLVVALIVAMASRP